MNPAVGPGIGLLLSTLATACAGEGPAQLPDPARSTPHSVGRLVRAASVSGYLARPLESTGPQPASLILVDALDPDTQSQTVALADHGGLALAVTPAISAADARDYLVGMADVSDVIVVCRRNAGCP